MQLEEYRKLDLAEFIQNYERMLMLKIEWNGGLAFETEFDEDKEEVILLGDGVEVDPLEIEKDFLEYLIDYQTRRENIYHKHLDHCLFIAKSSKLIRDPEHNLKMHFLEKKLEATKMQIDLKEKFSNLTSPPKKTISKGKKFNLSERFKIANEALGLWDQIDNKNILELKKYSLLATILGINEVNARKLALGNYDSKDRPHLINEYLDELGLK